MERYKKTLVFERGDAGANVHIEYENKRLTISGSVYDKDGFYSAGQCYGEIFRLFPESARLVEIWQRWHLNDMQAGDAEQEAYLRVRKSLEEVKTEYNYQDVCVELARVGLYDHDGYRYGSGWKFEAIPESVLVELKNIKGVKEKKYGSKIR